MSIGGLKGLSNIINTDTDKGILATEEDIKERV